MGSEKCFRRRNAGIGLFVIIIDYKIGGCRLRFWCLPTLGFVLSSAGSGAVRLQNWCLAAPDPARFDYKIGARVKGPVSLP